jgi:ubiquinone biosynthesis protein COQ9
MIVSGDQAEVIDALLPQVAFDGWTDKSLRQALVSLGRDPADAPLFFPNGTGEMIEAYCALADARMVAAADTAALADLRMPARVRAILALRLAQNRGDKEAIRRALAWLALPMNAAVAARTVAATVDAVWHAAGDAAADFSWYTKRGILAAVYSATLLFWLRDNSEDDEETLAFLDRRLGTVGQIGKLRKRVDERLAGVRQMVAGFTRRGV